MAIGLWRPIHVYIHLSSCVLNHLSIPLVSYGNRSLATNPCIYSSKLMCTESFEHTLLSYGNWSLATNPYIYSSKLIPFLSFGNWSLVTNTYIYIHLSSCVLSHWSIPFLSYGNWSLATNPCIYSSKLMCTESLEHTLSLLWKLVSGAQSTVLFI